MWESDGTIECFSAIDKLGLLRNKSTSKPKKNTRISDKPESEIRSRDLNVIPKEIFRYCTSSLMRKVSFLLDLTILRARW